MKKTIALIIGIMFLVLPFKVSAKDPANIYVFRGEGCPHCEELLEFLDSLDDTYKSYFNLVTYEVWNDQSNQTLMNQVAKKLNTTTNGVPFIVIGKKTFSGYSSSMSEEIKTAIQDLYNEEERYDVMSEELIEPAKKSSTIAVVAMVVLIILSASGLIYVISKSGK